MNDTTEKRCHWGRGERVLQTHLRSCRSAGCEGCEPCTEDHCVMPRCSNHLREYEPYVCARCVGRVRGKLQRVRDLCVIAPIVVTEGGTDSPVAVLVGPVPERSTHDARRTWALGGGLCRCGPGACPDHQALPAGPLCRGWKDCEHPVCRRRTGRAACPDLLTWLDNADDERHPLWVLGAWDMQVAEHLGHTRTMRVTVASAVAYLSANLTDLARDRDFAFDELAREVSACVEHIENVLAISTYIQRGAPCPVCQQAARPAKQLVREFNNQDPTGDSDLWSCPTPDCGETWGLKQYRKYVSGEYVDRAGDLTVRDLAVRTGVAAGTIRRWANVTRRVTSDGVTEVPARLKSSGRSHDGRKLYRVADVEALRDGEDMEVAG